MHISDADEVLNKHFLFGCFRKDDVNASSELPPT